MAPLSNQKITLIILLGNLFLAFLGISLVIPVMPTLMHELHISGSTMGYLVAMFAFFSTYNFSYCRNMGRSRFKGKTR